MTLISREILQTIKDSLSSDTTRHKSIEHVLDQLRQLEEAGDDATTVWKVWEPLSRDLWQISHESGILDQQLLEKLAEEIVYSTAVPKQDLDDVKAIAFQILNASDTNNDISAIVLPEVSPRIRDDSNMAFTLRALALNPNRVLPPGKSLMSLFMKQPDERNESERQREKLVADTLKRAYWDAAYDQLSSGNLEIQIPRIKVFYKDLFMALRPFVNQKHTLMVALTSPMSPSSNPLLSALHCLRACLALMRGICAPVRDQAIEDAIAAIDAGDDLHAKPQELARTYLDGIQFALEMSQTMSDDLQGFMAKYGSEGNVRSMLRHSARDLERSVIMETYGEKAIRQSWIQWAGQREETLPWTDKLVDVVGSLDPIMTSPDIIPPILKMSRVDLAEVQTLLLGLVIAASIRTLVPSLPSGRQIVLYRDNQSALDTERYFMERLWAIIGADPFATTQATKESDIDNIAEEVVRLWKQRNHNVVDTGAKEKELFEMVKRMVNDETHPVRVLLKKRILGALKERLSRPINNGDRVLPSRVAAGRALKPAARLKQPAALATDHNEQPLMVNGFGDPVLINHLTHILHTLRVVQEWTLFVWKEFL